MGALAQEERDALRSQIATLKTGRGQHRKYLPRASAAGSDCAVHAFVLMRNQRIAAHGALFRSALDPEDLTAIRLDANRSCTLGDARFRALIAAMVSRRAHVAPVGRPRRDAGKWT